MSGLGAREFISISFNADTLKIAYVADALARKEVVRLVRKNISGVSEQDMPKILRTCVNEIKSKNPFIVNVIPASNIITKNIEIPSIDHKEIKEIVNLQASRHTPYSREEIIIDYVDIGSYKSSYTKVLLIIVARPIIKRNFDILSKAKIEIERVLLAPEG